MYFTTDCPECFSSLKLKQDLAGQKIKCPKCSSVFIVDSVRSPNSEASIENACEAVGEQHHSKPSEPKSSGLVGKLGRFEIREKLGEGGFGAVYRVYDPLLDRETALKIPRRAAVVEEHFQRVLQEAKAAASLRNPNIVAVYEVGSIDGRCFIATEYVAGRTLAAELKTGQAGLRQRIEWLVALCRGLAYAHRQGIVHRDIKPHNVLIDENERAMLADFGLAMRPSSKAGESNKNVLVGTPAYMSPEQAHGDQSLVGPSSDQYSLGTILYEMLAGRRPFEGNSHSVIASIINDEIPRPSANKSEVDRSLEAIALKALSKNPADRYTNCDTMADDLQRWLAGELVEATHPTFLNRSIHWAKKRPHLAGWIAAGVATFMLLTGATATVGIAKVVAANTSLSDTQHLLSDSERALRDVKTQVELEAAERAEEIRVSNHKFEVAEYARTLEQIATAIEANRIAEAHDLLDRVPWRLRGIEHGLLRRRAMGTPFILHNDSPVTWLSWSHDSRLLASTDQQGHLRFWDAESCIPLSSHDLPGIVKAEFHPQKLEIVTIENASGLGYEMKVQDAPKIQTEVPSLIRVWSVERSADNITLSLARSCETPTILSDISIHPEGQFFAVSGRSIGTQPGVEIRKLGVPQLDRSISPQNLPHAISKVAYTVDGSRLDCLSETRKPDGTYLHYGIDSANYGGYELDTYPLRTMYVGGKLLSWDAKLIGRYGAETGQPTCSLQVGGERVWHGLEDGNIVDLLPASPQVQSGGYSRRRIGHMAPISCMAIRPDSGCFVSADWAGEIRFWPTTLRTHFGLRNTEDVIHCGGNFDGTLAAARNVDGSNLIVWSTTSGDTVFELAGHSRGIKAAKFHPTRNEIISIDGLGTAFVWNLQDGTLQTKWSVGPVEARNIAYDASGQIVSVAGTSADRGHLSVWNSSNGTQVREIHGHSKTVLHAEFVAEGELISASADGTLRRWGINSGDELARYDTGGLIPLDVSCSSRLLVAVLAEPCFESTPTNYRSSMRCWELATQVVRYDVSGGREPFRFVDMNASGDRFVASVPNNASIHESETGSLLFASPMEIPLLNMETKSKSTSITKSRMEQRTRDITVTKMRLEKRKRWVTSISAKATASGLLLEGLQIPPGTQVLSVFNSRGSALAPESVFHNGVYGRANAQSQLDLFSDKGLTKPIPVMELPVDESRVTIIVVGTFGDAAYEQIHEVQVPYQETMSQTYTVEVPYSETIVTNFTVEVAVDAPPRDVCFVEHSNAILHGDALLSGAIPLEQREFTGQADSYTSIAVSSDGKLIAGVGSMASCETCGGGIIDIWDSNTGGLINTISPPGEKVFAVAFDPRNDNLFVSTGCATILNVRNSRNLTSGTAIETPQASSDGAVTAYDPISGRQVATLLKGITPIVKFKFNNFNSPAILGVDNTGAIKSIDLERMKSTDLQVGTSDFNSFDASSNGEMFVFPDPSGQFRAALNNALARSVAFPKEVVSLQFSPDGVGLFAQALTEVSEISRARSSRFENHFTSIGWKVASIIQALKSDNRAIEFPKPDFEQKEWILHSFASGAFAETSSVDEVYRKYLFTPSILSAVSVNDFQRRPILLGRYSGNQDANTHLVAFNTSKSERELFTLPVQPMPPPKRRLTIHGKKVDVHSLRISRERIESTMNLFAWPVFSVNGISWEPKSQSIFPIENGSWLSEVSDMRSINVVPSKLDAFCYFLTTKYEDHIDIEMVHKPMGAGDYVFTLEYESDRQYKGPIPWLGKWKTETHALPKSADQFPDLKSFSPLDPVPVYLTDDLNWAWWSGRFSGTPGEVKKEEVFNSAAIKQNSLLRMTRSFESDGSPLRMDVHFDGIFHLFVDERSIASHWDSFELSTRKIELRPAPGRHTITLYYKSGTDLGRIALLGTLLTIDAKSRGSERRE